MSRRIWKELNCKLSESYRKDKIAYYENIGSNLAKAAEVNNIKEIYKYVKKLSGQSQKNSPTLVNSGYAQCL